ncbi:MAG: hypothetical protein HOP07_01280 [Bacteriovoracaceae bacterium]|nr:hypothetical protein [Bacteriovoracaceae bacterium]
MKNIFLGVLSALLFSSCSNKDIDSCVQRGITYYKEIGSYPILSDGKNAETVAIEKCSRTTSAF